MIFVNLSIMILIIAWSKSIAYGPDDSSKGIVGNKIAEETGHEGLRLAMPAHSDLCKLCGLLRQRA